ncbi:hypothetical protein [Devosia sp.]|uniref:hypothetical protein n=1 Tax=Devosia sp. TaxID=1871048 RepID=UPI0019FCCBF5|nr:hypothetical protein [Devosia sp.]MBE0578878.1 hypothetical protein [Devosia sp.]
MSMQQKAQSAARIIQDAGGRVVGRTRLQKIAYLLHAAGLEGEFSFVYKHYGPFSEDLAQYTRIGELLGLLSATEQQAQWGGSYSTYTVNEQHVDHVNSARNQLAHIAAEADAVELELAATAVFLQKEGYPDPWAETARRKPEKAEGGRIKKAKVLYRQLQAVQVPTALPNI